MKNGQPNIIVDFDLKEELMYILMRNLSNAPALDVQVEFSHPIIGLNGTKDMTKLPLFNSISFFAPMKTFRIFIDALPTFYKNLKQKKIKVVIRYKTEKEEKQKKVIIHNLSIYKDFPIVIKNN